MIEYLEKIIKEKISADHLLYVSMKYTKTCDVILNLIRRWKIMMDCCFEGILQKMKKEKKIQKIPTAPKLKIDLIKNYFKKDELIQDILKEYEIFQKIDILKKTKEGEFDDWDMGVAGNYEAYVIDDKNKQAEAISKS